MNGFDGTVEHVQTVDYLTLLVTLEHKDLSRVGVKWVTYGRFVPYYTCLRCLCTQYAKSSNPDGRTELLQMVRHNSIHILELTDTEEPRCKRCTILF